MADRLSPQDRSRNMAQIKGRDTGPELRVRRALHAAGFRFRLQRRDLPGRPDLVLPRWRTAIFVHGCFWHRHAGCRNAAVPKSRVAYWRAKFDANTARDARSVGLLVAQGWTVIVIWECETDEAARIVGIVRDRLPSAAYGPDRRRPRTSSATPPGQA
jgi:DNA mismatch endonuclease, patch repair protein